jgi:hypothetical protein
MTFHMMLGLAHLLDFCGEDVHAQASVSLMKCQSRDFGWSDEALEYVCASQLDRWIDSKIHERLLSHVNLP